MQDVSANIRLFRRPGRERSTILQRAGFFGLRLLLMALRCTTLRVNHFYGSCIGHVLWWLDSDLKRVTRKNLEIAYPGIDVVQREQLVKSSLIELGKTITELGHIWTVGEQGIRKLVIGVEGRHHIEEALAAGRGAIILAPHLGAWELLGLYLSLEFGITSLYRPPKMLAAERFARRTRERFGANLVPTDMGGVRALRKALKENTIIGILPDQDPGDAGSCFAPFFGRSALTMLLPSRLAAKTDCPVVYAFAERLQRGAGYRIHFLPADPDVASADDVSAATAVNRGVESLIRLNPPQYQWSYKRYKSTPTGEATAYSNRRRRAA